VTRPHIVVVVGPTGAGKTQLAIELAQACGGEVVSCDSQQVYLGMDIGTGKATTAERARVPHHLLDVIRPDEEMTAARFIAMADDTIAALAARGVPAVVCGGTGLYVRALLLGLFEGPPAVPAIRERLVAEAAAEGAPALHARLAAVDPALAPKIEKNDAKRIIRALEVYEATGVPMSEHQARHDHRSIEPRYPARVIGLAPPREDLYARIDARVDAMVAAGLFDEVARLRAAGYRPPLRSQQAIGYTEIHDHLDGGVARERTIELIKRNSRHYARRQLSWYRNDARVEWSADRSRVDLPGLASYLTPPASP
jgi:tRNA dimethylallyltransferase